MPPVVSLLIQAVAPQSNDWQKVGPALAGVVVGVLLEPLRVWIAGAMKRRQIRELLYRDVARVNACLDFATKQSQRALRERKKIPHTVRCYLEEVSLDVFAHVFNTERTSFYHLREARAFKRFYEIVEKHVLPLGKDADPASVIEACTEPRSVLEEYAAAGEIDRDRVRVMEKQYAERQANWEARCLAYIHEILGRFEVRREATKRKRSSRV